MMKNVAVLAALAALVVAEGRAAGAGAAGPVFGTYVDSKGINWSAQPPTPIVDVRATDYNVVFASFFLPSLNESTDFAYVLTNPDPAYGGPLFINQTHRAGKKILLTVGGATELPTSPDYFTKNDPTQLAQTLAALVLQTGIDGIVIDWEDDYSNANPGLTGYGDTRKPAAGPAIDWLVTLTTVLRKLLPSERGFLIGHAPQAPYFALGYDAVHSRAGSMIDFYTIQWYNQCPGCYETYQTLVIKEQISVPSSCVPVWDGSITDLVKNHSIPQEKIVVGKIVSQGDGNNGYIDPADLATDLSQALKLFPNLGGVFGWQWGSDTSGSWIKQVSGGFSNSTRAEKLTIV